MKDLKVGDLVETKKNLYDMNGDLYGYKVGARGFVESISTNHLGETLYHVIALCDGETMNGTEFYAVDPNRGGNYLREELKKGNLTWTEDDE